MLFWELMAFFYVIDIVKFIYIYASSSKQSIV